LNKTVELKCYGKDRYERPLCEVFVDGVNVNLAMVQAGLAEVYRGKHAKGFDPLPYRKAEEQARAEKIGIWSLPDYTSPREWRKIQRQK
jgi:endonuclease YncB( thermonuclease family)